MRQVQKKKEKDKVAIVLMLAFCVIALTSIFTVKSNIDKINESTDDILVSEDTKTDGQKEADNSQVQAPESSAEASMDIPTVDSLEQGSGQAGSSSFINPVKDDSAVVTNPYSMDQLIYSVTLDQYMTHCGTGYRSAKRYSSGSCCRWYRYSCL